jgi:hypothetical protein
MNSAHTAGKASMADRHPASIGRCRKRNRRDIFRPDIGPQFSNVTHFSNVQVITGSDSSGHIYGLLLTSPKTSIFVYADPSTLISSGRGIM